MTMTGANWNKDVYGVGLKGTPTDEAVNFFNANTLNGCSLEEIVKIYSFDLW